jgi:hypothetical protein
LPASPSPGATESGSEHTARNPKASTGYIRREDYHSQFNQLIATGIKLIILAGFPGTGKSWLADALTSEHSTPNADVPVITLANGKFAPETVQEALAIAHISVDTKDLWEHPERYLVDLLCGEKAPQFVILECNDVRETTNRLPARLKSVVVITCRVMHQLARTHAEIDVDHMERPESITLIQSRLPRISKDDADALAEALYDHPLLMRYSCGLLLGRELNVVQFCSAISSDVASLAGKADTDEGKSLLAVLTRLTKLVKKENEMAYEMLTCMA